ncbi:MAG: hypothetical protein WBP81_06140, partial [Solirubrobacteraceae bacterium]
MTSDLVKIASPLGRQSIKLVRFSNQAESAASAQQLAAAAQQAQTTPQGRARLALPRPEPDRGPS